MGIQRLVFNKRLCMFILAFYSLVALIPSTGEASLIESRLSTGEKMSERTEHIESIRKALEHEVVAQRLADYGLSQEEVMARMEGLDDKQLHQLATLSDEVGGGGIGLAIGVLLIVLLVVLILNISDRRIVVQ